MYQINMCDKIKIRFRFLINILRLLKTKDKWNYIRVTNYCGKIKF